MKFETPEIKVMMLVSESITDGTVDESLDVG